MVAWAYLSLPWRATPHSGITQPVSADATNRAVFNASGNCRSESVPQKVSIAVFVRHLRLVGPQSRRDGTLGWARRMCRPYGTLLAAIAFPPFETVGYNLSSLTGLAKMINAILRSVGQTLRPHFSQAPDGFVLKRQFDASNRASVYGGLE